MDANHVQDEVMGMEDLDISHLMLNFPTDYMFKFIGGSKVYTTIIKRKK